MRVRPGIGAAGGQTGAWDPEPDPMKDLFDTFHRGFEVVPAEGPELVEAALRLRYQVYCREHGFEDPDQHPDGLERDPFDARAVHTLVRHRRSGRFVGTVRLVLPDAGDSAAPFPIEAHCRSAFYQPSLGTHLPRKRVAEISRFAVSREFRRRMAEDGPPSPGPRALPPTGPIPDSPQRHLPHITVGLFAGIVRMSALHGVSHWYAAMEPALLRLLTRFGIHFQSIGRTVAYHGRRRPTLGVAQSVLDRIHRERPEVWRVITDRGRVLPPDGGNCLTHDSG